MKEVLSEVLAKAADNPGSFTDFTFEYERGHELSGVLSFEFGGRLTFQLNSTNPWEQTSYS